MDVRFCQEKELLIRDDQQTHQRSCYFRGFRIVVQSRQTIMRTTVIFRQ